MVTYSWSWQKQKYIIHAVHANLELVDMLYYLGDMLSVDRDAHASLETRIQTGWNKIQAVGTTAYQ